MTLINLKNIEKYNEIQEELETIKENLKSIDWANTTQDGEINNNSLEIYLDFKEPYNTDLDSTLYFSDDVRTQILNATKEILIKRQEKLEKDLQELFIEE